MQIPPPLSRLACKVWHALYAYQVFVCLFEQLDFSKLLSGYQSALNMHTEASYVQTGDKLKKKTENVTEWFDNCDSFAMGLISYV